jgi:hypothetical protein
MMNLLAIRAREMESERQTEAARERQQSSEADETTAQMRQARAKSQNSSADEPAVSDQGTAEPDS